MKINECYYELSYLWLILACSCDVSSSARSVTSLSESDSDGTYFLSKDEYLPDDVRNLRFVSIHASPASYTKQSSSKRDDKHKDKQW